MSFGIMCLIDFRIILVKAGNILCHETRYDQPFLNKLYSFSTHIYQFEV